MPYWDHGAFYHFYLEKVILKTFIFIILFALSQFTYDIQIRVLGDCRSKPTAQSFEGCQKLFGWFAKSSQLFLVLPVA